MARTALEWCWLGARTTTVNQGATPQQLTFHYATFLSETLRHALPQLHSSPAYTDSPELVDTDIDLDRDRPHRDLLAQVSL